MIGQLEPRYAEHWDGYVRGRADSTLYHLAGWENVIRLSYGHRTLYLMAWDENESKVVGVLPMVYLRHVLFGKRVVSIPYFDLGGVLADNEEVERSLIEKAWTRARELGADYMELRHIEPLPWLDSLADGTGALRVDRRSHKVRMILDLPASSEELMKSLKSKLRSQIKVPQKEGLVAKVGGGELIGDFYTVFATNMRDLGSPVHARKIIEMAVASFPDTARVVMVYQGDQPVAGSVVIGYGEILENPWASSLRQYSRLSPNMLLYWTMLAYAADQGYKQFDFGRSSVGEGTFRFKEQWGAKPVRLNWQYVLSNREMESSDEKSGLGWTVDVWKKLPVSLSKVIGPRIRKHISL